MTTSRRDLLKFSAFGGAALFAGLPLSEAAAQASELTIAYNVNLPSWDPTVGPSAVNPTIQSFYKSVFDQYINQNADCTCKPGLLTKWVCNDDKSKIMLQLRDGACWHDGSPVTAEDVVWSLERAGD